MTTPSPIWMAEDDVLESFAVQVDERSRVSSITIPSVQVGIQPAMIATGVETAVVVECRRVPKRILSVDGDYPADFVEWLSSELPEAPNDVVDEDDDL